jgi:hypothetical protein
MNAPTINHFIEMYWEGPFSLKQVKKKKDLAVDYGLYQIYGNHEVHGPQSLLYIGMANQMMFGERFEQHSNWLKFESDQVSIYLGYLGSKGSPEIKDDDWEELIAISEKLIIHYCSPAYNTQHLNEHPTEKGVVVMNYGKKFRIPFTLNSFANNYHRNAVEPNDKKSNSANEPKWHKYKWKK